MLGLFRNFTHLEVTLYKRHGTTFKVPQPYLVFIYSIEKSGGFGDVLGSIRETPEGSKGLSEGLMGAPGGVKGVSGGPRGSQGASRGLPRVSGGTWSSQEFLKNSQGRLRGFQGVSGGSRGVPVVAQFRLVFGILGIPPCKIKRDQHRCDQLTRGSMR